MPEPDHLRTNALLAGLFALVFLVFYGGASVASGFMPYRIHVDFPFESKIPFVPAASWLYVSMDALLMLGPFVLRTPRQYMPLFLALCAETILSFPVFVLLPVETSFPSRVVHDASAGVFAFADTLNLERNFLPSLHVAFSFTAAQAYAARTRSLAVKASFYAWALGIAVSTMLIHEHHLLDVLAGFLVALCAARFVTAPLLRPRAQEALALEGLFLRQMWQFGKRHGRYLRVAALVLLGSLPRYRKRRILRSGYVFLQLVDDLLDGDRVCEGEPYDLIERLLGELQTRSFGSSELSTIACAYLDDLDALDLPQRNLLGTTIELVRVMQRDRLRARDGLLYDARELREHHRATFQYSLDLLLAALGSPLRGSSVPALLDAFAWASTARDLDSDLRQGLINVPREVLEAAGLTNSLADVHRVLSAPEVNRWLCEQGSAALRDAESALTELARFPDGRGKRVLVIFARSIRKRAALVTARLRPTSGMAATE
jgi:membrane-associated phospholipid phosphatase